METFPLSAFTTQQTSYPFYKTHLKFYTHKEGCFNRLPEAFSFILASPMTFASYPSNRIDRSVSHFQRLYPNSKCPKKKKEDCLFFCLHHRNEDKIPRSPPSDFFFHLIGQIEDTYIFLHPSLGKGEGITMIDLNYIQIMWMLKVNQNATEINKLQKQIKKLQM